MFRHYAIVRMSVAGICLCQLLVYGGLDSSTSARGQDFGVSSGQPTTIRPSRLTSQHLPNLVRLHPRVISGGLPEGDLAFQELAERGVTTIISVDGMAPDVATANKFGLRYVHLPHGYDGIPQSRVQELAKAIREFDGLIFIHCHHGKHRSPAAATAACIAAGLIPATQAVSILQLAGTSPNYQGLYLAASKARAIEASALDELVVEFKDVQAIPPMAEAMVQLGQAHERLKLLAASGWRAPDSHPDLDAAHESLLLRELFTELIRSKDVAGRSRDFRNRLTHSESVAHALESEIRDWARSSESPGPPTRLQELASEIDSDCQSCHRQYRDRPFAPTTVE